MKRSKSNWFVLVGCVIGAFASIALAVNLWVTVSSNSTLHAQQHTQSVSDCRLRIAGEYEDKRDDILGTIGTAKFAAAVVAFDQFRLGPDGKLENRAERSQRECGS